MHVGHAVSVLHRFGTCQFGWGTCHIPQAGMARSKKKELIKKKKKKQKQKKGRPLAGINGCYCKHLLIAGVS
jgi:hypothetical protein